MSNTNTNNKTAQPVDEIRVRIKQAYVDEHAHVIRVYQSGVLVPEHVVASQQASDNTARHEVNIPLAGVRLQRIVDGAILVNKELPADVGEFAHPCVFHHGHRLTVFEWTVTINGHVYRTYDPKRNYSRRLRDLVNVCDRLMGLVEQ